jgi:response regulator RpfG family c-di-GMP phosphodiesterase
MKSKPKLNATKPNGRGKPKSSPVEPEIISEEVKLEDAQHPVDHIEKITELEVMTFRALDAEIRNLELSARALTLEMQNAQNEMEKAVATFKKQQEARQASIDQAQHSVSELKPRYIQLINGIASKYKLDPNFMTIDPEARTVRDLRGEVTQDS